jgi:hypothetical protein
VALLGIFLAAPVLGQRGGHGSWGGQGEQQMPSVDDQVKNLTKQLH